MSAFVVIAAALVAGMAHGAARASPGHSGDRDVRVAPSRIVFQRGRHVWVTDIDGTHLRRLTRWGTEPAVSPDGGTIAFVRDESIWVMSREGSAQQQLTSGHRDHAPTWSPDGATIYFSRIVEGTLPYSSYAYAAPIFRLRADGSGVTQVTRPELSEHGTCHDGPNADPSGRLIAFSSFGDCDHGLDVTIEASRSNGRRATLARFDLPYGAFDPDWSPEGRRLVFALHPWDSERAGIAITTAGGSTRRIYRRSASHPAWSPDGRWVAFVRGDGTGRIWIMRPDGSDLRRVSSRRYDGSPAWLPPLHR